MRAFREERFSGNAGKALGDEVYDYDLCICTTVLDTYYRTCCGTRRIGQEIINSKFSFMGQGFCDVG